MRIHITGGQPLVGSVRVGGAKNACLPILAACVLVDGKTIIRDVPKIRDIDNLLHILAGLGIRIEWHDGDVHLDTEGIGYNEINAESAKKIRGSIFLLGSILGRFKRAKLPYPGGCKIGARPIDLHLGGFSDIGITVRESKQFVSCNSRKMKGGVVYLDFPSVGATENLVLASVRGRNTVKIINAAKEPEVVDLCDFLIACGACITGHGTDTIVVHGVDVLRGVTYTPIPDRINTASYMLAVAATGGDVMITNVIPQHNAGLIRRLEKLGVSFRVGANRIRVISSGRDSQLPVKSLTIQTAPYPGFSTDIQSQFAAMAASRGIGCLITENLFESRFRYLAELEKFGVRSCLKGRVANVRGVGVLTAGTRETPLVVFATDLRGGVAMVIAALVADGETIIENAEQIARGHADIVGEFQKLGANIF